MRIPVALNVVCKLGGLGREVGVGRREGQGGGDKIFNMYQVDFQSPEALIKLAMTTLGLKM